MDRFNENSNQNAGNLASGDSTWGQGFVDTMSSESKEKNSENERNLHSEQHYAAAYPT